MLIKAKKIFFKKDFIKTINTGSCPFVTSTSATTVFFVWPYQNTLFFILLQWVCQHGLEYTLSEPCASFDPLRDKAFT